MQPFLDSSEMFREERLSLYFIKLRNFLQVKVQQEYFPLCRCLLNIYVHHCNQLTFSNLSFLCRLLRSCDKISCQVTNFEDS